MSETFLLPADEVPPSLRTSAADRSGFEPAYPFESHWMKTPDGILHYIDEGSGPVLLMVHGNPTWSFAWRHLIEHLRTDFRVLAVDHLGCGFSEKPADGPYVLDAHIRRLKQFVTALDLHRITLFAHDWGGAIGMGCAGQQPDRFDRFVLMNTAAFRSRRIPLRIAVCRIPLLGTLAVQGLNLFSLAALQMASERPLSAEAKAGLLRPYRSAAERIAVREFVHDIPMKPGHRSYTALTDVEQSLNQQRGKPMQFIWGMRDWCFSPEFLAEFRRRFPDAFVHEIPDAGHYVLEDAPDEVLQVSRHFLTATGRGSSVDFVAQPHS